jgi:hypothetical protein
MSYISPQYLQLNGAAHMSPPPTPPIPDPANRAPRKRKITARARDNADPLLPNNKKARVPSDAQAPAKKKTHRPKSKATLPNMAAKEHGKQRHHIPVDSDVDAEDEEVPDGDTADAAEDVAVAVMDVDLDPSETTDTEPEVAEESCEAELSE